MTIEIVDFQLKMMIFHSYVNVYQCVMFLDDPRCTPAIDLLVTIGSTQHAGNRSGWTVLRHAGHPAPYPALSRFTYNSHVKNILPSTTIDGLLSHNPPHLGMCQITGQLRSCLQSAPSIFQKIGAPKYRQAHTTSTCSETDRNRVYRTILLHTTSST